MKLLAEIFEKDVCPDLDTDPDVLFVDSYSARALMFSDKGEVALMHVAKKNFYLLPGGTLDEGEDFEDALYREIMEEVGCEVVVDGVLGDTVEYRDKVGIKKMNRCFFGRAGDSIQDPEFTEEESTNGAEIVWVRPDRLISVVESSHPTGYKGKFTVPRCLAFLNAAKRRGLLDR